jgi:K+-sensing histidine kinase KdpD
MKLHLVDRDTQFKIRADPDLIRQVFMNLFDNCVKYGETNTDILVKLHIQKSTNDLMIEVVGTSAPVPQELRERIFDLGFRGENARQVVASGTGLGLYICRAIVAVYKGTIQYKARPSANESTFNIRIPGGWV